MLVPKSLAALFVASALGCTPPRQLAPPPPPLEHAFTCHGTQGPPPVLPPTLQLPAGRLDVDALDARAPNVTTQAALLARRVRVSADGTPLGTLALALGDKLGVGVVVAAELGGVRVFLSMPNGAVEHLILALRDELRVWCSFDAETATLRFETREVSLSRLRASTETAPLATRLEPVKDGASPEQMASTFCEAFASPHGLAAVMGRSLLVRDLDRNLDLFEEAAQAAGVLGAPPKKRP
jgi:hypothetical protein